MSAMTHDDATSAGAPGGSGADDGAASGVDPASMGTRTGALDDSPVTGPLPMIDLAEGHLHVTTRRDVTIVAIDGALDDALAAELAPEVARTVRGAHAVVLDLDHATLLERSALERVCEPVLDAPDGPECCLVESRLSGRMVLERWGFVSRCVVFASVADALQARAFQDSGYGTGWSSASA